MSYRRDQSNLSYPFIRSVFVVLLIVLIYSLQQMSNAVPTKTKLFMPADLSDQLISANDVPQSPSEQEEDSEEAIPLLFSELLLTLRR